MTEVLDDSREWVAGLPTLEGIFPEPISTSALLRPFSRLSIPFFRRTTSTPQSLTSLQQVVDVAEELKNGGELDDDQITKSLVDLSKYAREVKERLSKPAGPDSQSHVDNLAEGYLRGFYLICVLQRKTSITLLNRAATDCLTGLVLLARVVRGDIAEMIQKSICQAIFGLEEAQTTTEPYLSPIFLRTRQLTNTFLHGQLKRPSPTHKGGGSVDLIVRSVSESDNENQAIHHMRCLELFSNLVAAHDTLPTGRPTEQETKGAAKLRKDRDGDRPLRIVLEASIARCELATALASTDISNVNVRSRVDRDPKEQETVSLRDTDSETSEVGSELEPQSDAEDDNDVKPVLKDEGISSRTPSPREEETTPSIPEETHFQLQWGEQAEVSLLSCLQQIGLALKARRMEVITKLVRPTDWCHTETQSTLPQDNSDTASETDSDSLVSDDEEDASSGLSPGDKFARPPPLRTIFRLQDRYEELRLAVWLSLPPDNRQKMSAYMRGIPTTDEIRVMEESGLDPEDIKSRKAGRIGKAWDDLGSVLLKHFDSNTLLDFGLDLDKLDKWQELAWVKNSKKAKKSRKTM